MRYFFIIGREVLRLALHHLPVVDEGGKTAGVSTSNRSCLGGHFTVHEVGVFCVVVDGLGSCGLRTKGGRYQAEGQDCEEESD